MSDTKSYSYKGYILNSSPHSIHDGEFIVNGWITDIRDDSIIKTPYFGSKKYAKREEADADFFNFAKKHIDNM